MNIEDDKKSSQNKKETIFLILGILIAASILIGGTYAYFTESINVTNNAIGGNTSCFDIYYQFAPKTFYDDQQCRNLPDLNYDNVINSFDTAVINDYVGNNYSSDNICSLNPSICDVDGSGSVTTNDVNIYRRCAELVERAVIFLPVYKPSEGSIYQVNIKTIPACQGVSGTGKLKLYVNASTSSKLLSTVGGHCENKNTLETLKEYSDSASCESSSSRKWVTNGTAVKYAIYNNTSGTGNPITAGYVTQNSIGSYAVLYDGFAVNNVENIFYVYIWMDGNLTDGSYSNLTLDSYVRVNVTQNR